MSDTEKTPADQPDAPLNESDRAARRRLVKSAAVLVPSIVTLRARPAWAQVTDTSTGYVEAGESATMGIEAPRPMAIASSTAGISPAPSSRRWDV